MEKKSDKKGEPILNKERINTTNKKTRAFSLHRSIQRTHHVYVQRLLQDRHTLCSTQRMA